MPPGSVGAFPAEDGFFERTLRSSCKSCDFSMIWDSTGLHFEASLTRAKICFEGDLWPLELKTLDFSDPA